MHRTFSFDIEKMNLEQAGCVSSTLKRELLIAGIDKKTIRRIAIATYEAEINMVFHSFGGTCSVSMDDEWIIIRFRDCGPGIENLQKAMMEGYSTASDVARENGFGAGMGLPNIKNACDELYIQTNHEGTDVLMKFVVNGGSSNASL
jgi:anti-sigma regulatory factor (Ser/Thr protein kinase)